MKRPGESNASRATCYIELSRYHSMRGIINNWTGPIAPAPLCFPGADGRSPRKNQFSASATCIHVPGVLPLRIILRMQVPSLPHVYLGCSACGCALGERNIRTEG